MCFFFIDFSSTVYCFRRDFRVEVARKIPKIILSKYLPENQSSDLYMGLVC